MQYRVVSPLLTSSGDYTPVYALIATSKVSFEIMVLWKLVYWVFDLIKYQIMLNYNPVYALLIATSKVGFEIMVQWKLTYWVFDLIKYKIILNYNPVYALLITTSKVSFEIMVLWKLNYRGILPN